MSNCEILLQAICRLLIELFNEIANLELYKSNLVQNQAEIDKLMGRAEGFREAAKIIEKKILLKKRANHFWE